LFAIQRSTSVSWLGFSPTPRGAPVNASRGKIHYAWVVLGALVVVMLFASGLRAVFGVFIKPMEATFGWGVAALSGAAAVSLLLLGASGPIVGWLADRWGPRRVIFVSAIVLGVGTLLHARGAALREGSIPARGHVG